MTAGGADIKDYFVQGPDDWQQFYVKEAEKSVTKIEKHYVLVITLAGFGILGYAVMKSGCRNLTSEKDIKYWFDELVELGIGTAEEEAMLRAMTWNVCSSAPLHSTG